MDLGKNADLFILHDMIRVLSKVRGKYWKVGKIVATTPLPKDVKDAFYSLGNDIEQFLKLGKMLGQPKEEASVNTLEKDSKR